MLYMDNFQEELACEEKFKGVADSSIPTPGKEVVFCDKGINQEP